MRRWPPVYDTFTASYNYERWTGGILAAAEAQGLGGRRLLDVACGTGKSFQYMLQRGVAGNGVRHLSFDARDRAMEGRR